MIREANAKLQPPLEAVGCKLLFGSLARRQSPYFVGQRLRRGAPWAANLNLLSHLDHHEILPNLYGP